MWSQAVGSAPDDMRSLQHAVLSVEQAQQLYGAGSVRAELRAQRWQRPHRRVLVLHNGPLTRRQRIWAAILAAPPGAALWGPTATELDGLTRFLDEAVHVVVPQGQRRLTLEGVQTHWSITLQSPDVHPLAAPRRTRLPRSLLDMASDAAEERRARDILLSAAQQRLVVARSLREALDRRGPCRHRALITETLADIDGGIHSVPERDFDRIVVGRDLPRPTRQAVRRRPGGRYYLDALWESFAICAEVDGAHHRLVGQWDDDLDRAAEIVAGGLRLLRFSSFAVRRRPQRVGDLLVRSLRSGGWRG